MTEFSPTSDSQLIFQQFQLVIPLLGIKTTLTVQEMLKAEQNFHYPTCIKYNNVNINKSHTE
jgi:hypothetical protein